MIRAPYNFVPASGRVFYPLKGNEKKDISLDVPYKDGISGSLDMTITAETPVFVRNGHGKSNEEEGKSFCVTPDGKYFIPATSVKGCIRNVLEILSFGKMSVDQSSAFAQREWNNSELYSIKSPTEQSHLKCGWLVRRGEGFVVRQCCGKPQRINLRRIDEWLNETTFESRFSADGNRFDLNKETDFNGNKYDPKTARFKYALLSALGVSKKDLHNLHFSEDNEYTTEITTRYKIDNSGSLTGTLVLTGQPDKARNWRGQRQINNGKFYEFIFEEEIEREFPMTELEFSNYNYIYADSEDWKEWQDELDGDGIPVFFRTVKENGKVTIKDMGLALLYKLPYENTPYDLEEKRRAQQSKCFEPDMAECIFGYTDGDNSQKGRVMFSNFISENAVPDKSYTLIMNSPKASYYPIYIQQDGRGGITHKYKTYNDGKLAGWKRYYLREGVWVKNMNNPNVDTTIYPLKASSTFKGKVYFHNLKPEELGALLSAITFHDNDLCRHQIGQAKAYGFGKVKVTVNKESFVDNEHKALSFDYMLALFEKRLQQDGFYLEKDESICQLMTMASINIPNDESSQYMVLDVDNRNDEFTKAKGGVRGDGPREYLQSASVILKNRKTVESKYAKLKAQLDADEENAREYKEKLAELTRRLDSEYSTANTNFEAENWKRAKELYINSKDYLNDLIEFKKDSDTSDLDGIGQIIDKKISDCEGHIGAGIDSNANIADLLQTAKYPVDVFDKWANNKGSISADDVKVLISFFNARGNNDKKKLVNSRFVKKNKELQKNLKKELGFK